jgi:hypothetical protein
MMSQIFGKLGNEPLRFLSKPVFFDNSFLTKDAGLKELALQTGPGIVPHDFTKTVGPSANDKQFYLYQLGGDKAPLIDPHNAEPTLEGSDKEPDTLVSVELESFNFSRSLNVDSDTRATLRLDIGKDDQARSNLDLLLWSVSSAIDLAQQFKKGKTAKPADLNFKAANVFKSGPAQIPGSLGKLTIEVVKHNKPSIWDEIWGAVTGKAGQTLITTLGFPAITLQALDFLNGVFSQFAENSAEPLFQSQPITLAFTKRAKTDFAGDTPNMLVAAMNPGRYVFARQADAVTLGKASPLYLGGVGALVPKADYQKNPNGYDLSTNPLNDITYGILHVRSKTAQLDWSAST